MSNTPVGKYGDWVDYLTRKISGPIALMLLKTGISPNSITIFRSLFIWVALYLFFKAGFYSIILAGIILQICDILDYVDGDLARLTGKTSVLGEWLEYFENNFQGTSGSLLGLFITLGLFRKTHDVRIFIVLFFLCFGFHMKKALIHTPIKADNWFFNLLDKSSFQRFQNETNSNTIVKMGKIFLWLSTRDVNIIFLVSVLLPFTYSHFGLSSIYYALILVAIAHNLTWMGIAYYQLKFILRKK